jgi:hypothetical protein
MSDPLAGMKTTYCVACGDQFAVDEYAWSDTNESIADYYLRHQAGVRPSDLFWCGNGGLLLLVLIGLSGGAVFGLIVGMLVASWIIGLIIAGVLAMAGMVVAIVIRESMIAPKIRRRVCGVEDTRTLR